MEAVWHQISENEGIDPRTCSLVSTVLEAAILVRDANCGVVPVTEAGWPVGVITDRDIAMALPDHEDDLPRIPVSEVMTGPLVTVDRDATLESAVDKLGGEGVRRLLVVDSAGMLADILSRTDLAPHASGGYDDWRPSACPRAVCLVD